MASSSSNEELKNKLAVTEAVKPGKTIADLLEQQKPEISKALPKHMDEETFVRVALTTAKTGNGLLECTPQSFLASLMLCAQLGFEPGPLGYVWFIPRNSKVKDAQGRERWEKQCTFQIGYQGWADLARRSGEVAVIEARAVYPGDHFEVEYGSNAHLTHRPGMNPQGMLGTTWENKSQVLRDPDAVHPSHVYAFVRLTNGQEQFVSMAWDDAMAYRGFAKTKGVWDEHPLPMALKTVFLRLKTWLPRSIEMDRASIHDGTAPTSIAPNMLEAAPAEIDAESAPELDAPADVREALEERISGFSDGQIAVLDDRLSGAEIPLVVAEMSDEQVSEVWGWEL